MKKIYAILATACFGQMLSAATPVKTLSPDFFEPKAKTMERSNARVLESVNPQLLTDRVNQLKSLRQAPSRAEEDSVIYVDPTKFTISTYLDYFYNLQDAYGNKLPQPLNVLSSNAVEIEVDSIDSSVLNVNSLGGYAIPWQIINDAEYGPVVKLGTQVASFDDGTPIILASVGDNNVITDALMPVDVYQDGIKINYYFGIGFYEGPQFYWLNGGLCVGISFQAPNALLKYTAPTTAGTMAEIEKPVIAAITKDVEFESEVGPYTADVLSVSGVMPWDEGVVVDFEMRPFTENEYVILAENQICSPWEIVEDGTSTGNFVLSTVYQAEGEQVANWGFGLVVAEQTTEDKYTAIKWACNFEGVFSDVIGWGGYADASDYIMGAFGPATLLLDYDFDTNSGVTDIINDNNAGGPAEYYTLQGVKVNNPEPGRIYIVKEGNKVKKQIIR